MTTRTILKATNPQVPVVDDLFRWTDDGVDLVGTRCEGCGNHYFPKSLSCRNPACTNKSVSEVLFGRHGRLHSYTVQGYQPPPLFRVDSWAPYGIGLVELPEGLRVMGMLTGCSTDELEIGMAVDLTVEALYTDDDGRDVLTYKYTPSHKGAE